MSSITVAIAGATGTAGSHITRAFLSSTYFPHKIGRVVAFTRDTSSKKAEELKALGAELYTEDQTAEALKGVDVVVNALTTGAGLELANSYAKAAAEAGAKVYFPSELGFDHYNYAEEDPVFAQKKAHDKFARGLGLKVISVIVTCFLTPGLLDFGAPAGLDYAAGVFTAIGSPDAKMTFAGLPDIGSSIVRLSLLALENPESVPDLVRLSGDSRSYRELAEIIGKETGKTIKVASIDKETYLAATPAGFITTFRVILGSGIADFSEKNDNELVNPDQKYWKWETVEDCVRAKKGVFGFHR